MHGTRCLTAFVAVSLVTVACAAATQGNGASTRSSREPITVEELVSHQRLSNALEAVQSLRPRWLRPRGPASFSGAAPVIVFMDNVRMGGVDFLLGIPLDRVTQIRYFDAADATTKWGTGVAGGAIEVVTTSPLKPGRA